MLIRQVEISDAEEFLNLQLELDKETKFMLLEPGEREKDANRTKVMIESILKANDFLFVAEIAGELIGFITASRGNANRIKHRAYVVMGIKKEFHGRGVGTELLYELERWAARCGIRRLELTVMVHNVKAISLYEKFGFVIEGVKKDSMCIDGEYVDEYYMGKILVEAEQSC